MFEQSLIEHTKPYAGTGINVPPIKEVEVSGVPKPVTGIGDLRMLLNPALEAYQFERFNRLYRGREYDHRQEPVVFVVSSENDTARPIAFPMSRWFSLPFRPLFRDSEQAALFKDALGDYKPQVTHQLKIAAPGIPDATCRAGDLDCLKSENESDTVCMARFSLTTHDLNRIAYSP